MRHNVFRSGPVVLLLGSLWSLGGGAANAYDKLIGKAVIAVRPEATVRLEPSDEAQSVNPSIAGHLFSIEAENGEWLKIANASGWWIRRSEVVPLSDAIEHFTAVIGGSATAYAYAARSHAYLAEKKDLRLALVDAEEAVSLDAACAEAFASRAACKEKQGRFADAIADYSQAIALDPKLVKAHYSCAGVRLRTHDVDGAIRDVTAAIDLSPMPVSLLLSRAEAYRVKGVVSQAAGKLHEAESAFAASTEDLSTARQNLSKQKAPHDEYSPLAEKRRALARVLSNTCAESFAKLGEVRMSLGMPELAFRDFTEAIRFEPDHFNAHLHRADALFKLGMYADAAQDLQHALRSQPDSVLAHVQLGTALNKLGEYDRAIDQWSELIRLGGKTAEGLRLRGQTKSFKGDHAAAVADLTEAIALQPDLGYLYGIRGEALVKLGDQAAAMKDFDHALELDPNDIAGRLARAELLSSQGRYLTAFEDCQAAIRVDPKCLRAYHYRGKIQAMLRNYDEGYDDLTTAISMDPNNATLHKDRARISVAARRASKALDDLNVTIRICPDDSEAYRMRSATWEKLKNNELAEKDLAEAKRLESARKSGKVIESAGAR